MASNNTSGRIATPCPPVPGTDGSVDAGGIEPVPAETHRADEHDREGSSRPDRRVRGTTRDARTVMLEVRVAALETELTRSEQRRLTVVQQYERILDERGTRSPAVEGSENERDAKPDGSGARDLVARLGRLLSSR